MLNPIFTITCIFSVVFGLFSGNYSHLDAALSEGVYGAVKFCLTTGGLICLWSGIMEVLRVSGATELLSRILRPVLVRLFPRACGDGETMDALCANVSANLLGLGNAATPMGIRAAEGMTRLGRPGYASDELCMLVVINTASIQLLPTTVGSVRASLGAYEPFDILPAVWLASALSVMTGIAAAKLLSRVCAP